MAFYRFVLLTLAIPVLLAGMLLRLVTGRERPGDLAERLGGGSSAPAAGPVIWLHGASVGELAAARPLVDELLSRDPALRLVVTANTLTGRASVAGWGLPRVQARLAPLDSRRATVRFLRNWRPVALIQTEKEYWPNRMALARSRGMAVMQAAALMSERSARRWARAPGLAAAILGMLDHVAPQNAESEARLLTLGLPPARIGARLNLKAGARLAEPDPAALAALAVLLPRDRTWLAASTHAGEEEIVLEAHRRARARLPGLRLVLAPRHPERGEDIARLIARTGLTLARRSRGEQPGQDTAVCLADTLGEMGLWYRLAPLAFVGGSLAEKGGHNPYEPAQLGCAILHGPHVANNADAYRHLHLHRAAAEVRDAAALSAEVLRLLSDDEARQVMVRRARRALEQTGEGADGLAAFVRVLAALAHLPALEPAEKRHLPGKV